MGWFGLDPYMALHIAISHILINFPFQRKEPAGLLLMACECEM
jgi:hypothetical protein